jgi:hypothetical protein
MAEYKLNKTVYPKGIYENIIDISFSQNSPTSKEDTISVEQFFSYYNSIFYDIPIEGDINSHAYLVQKSGDYIGTTGLNDDIQVLLDEISSLQQQNLALNQQITSLQISGSTNNI